MKWAALGEVTKVMITSGVTLIGSLGAALVFMFTNFTPKEDFQAVKSELPTYLTVAQDKKQWQYHQQSVACNKVSDLRVEIELLLVELGKPGTSEERKAEIRARIEILRAEIERRDPGGVC